jgi:hypothetical protein
VDIEDAARSRHQLDGADARLKLFEDSRCQTDSVWQRASRNAVLDANDGSSGHEPMLSPDREYGRRLDRGSLRFRNSKATGVRRAAHRVPVTAPQNRPRL